MDRQTNRFHDANDSRALLRERDLARRWDKSLRTLQRWRYEKTGPAFIRIGGTVFYRLGDVLAFEDAARQDPGGPA